MKCGPLTVPKMGPGLYKNLVDSMDDHLFLIHVRYTLHATTV